LYKSYKGNEDDYPKYVNYDAIEVRKVKDIPVDYISFLFTLISYFGYSQTTKVLNGNKEKEFIRFDDTTGYLYHKNELYTGVYESYHEILQLFLKGSYLNGALDGVWEAYHENGKQYQKYLYINGKPVDGIYTDYHENGKIWEKGSYLNGKRNGVCEIYHENGQLSSKGSYLNGEKDGVWEE
jgi:antitoxin component YwqK of YwqJK toxin-antitoxin module